MQHVNHTKELPCTTAHFVRQNQLTMRFSVVGVGVYSVLQSQSTRRAIRGATSWQRMIESSRIPLWSTASWQLGLRGAPHRQMMYSLLLFPLTALLSPPSI